MGVIRVVERDSERTVSSLGNYEKYEKYEKYPAFLAPFHATTISTLTLGLSPIQRIMFANFTNEQCSQEIGNFLGFSECTEMMFLNRESTTHGIRTLCNTLGTNFVNIQELKSKICRLSVVPNSWDFSTKLIVPTVENIQAMYKKKCLICKEKCHVLSQFGIMVHLKCIKKDQVTSVKKYDRLISKDVVKKMKHLVHRIEMKRGIYVPTYVNMQYTCFAKGIPGVIPDEFCLEWNRVHKVEEILALRAVAASEQDVSKLEEKEARAKRKRDCEDEISEHVGMSFKKWKKNVPSCFANIVTLWESSDDCLRALEVILGTTTEIKEEMLERLKKYSKRAEHVKRLLKAEFISTYVDYLVFKSQSTIFQGFQEWSQFSAYKRAHGIEWL